MEDVKGPKVEQVESESGRKQTSTANACCSQRGLCRRYGFYLFPVSALIASVILVSLAFKTRRPGVSLGFSFLLLIPSIFYCVIGNVIRTWLPESQQDQSDSDCDKWESKVSVVVDATEEQVQRV